MTLCDKLRQLREKKGLLLRQVAAALEVDTAFVSKLERNEKPMNKIHLQKFTTLYEISEDDLLPYWLAEKVRKTIQNEMFSKQALEIVLKDLQ